MRIIVCPKCQKTVEHYGNGYCKKCYMRIYRNNPEHKKKHAEYEKKRRKIYSDVYKEHDKKRNKTQKRIDWARKYGPGYYKKNREALLLYQRNYRKKNKEKIREADRLRKRIQREDARNFSLRDWHNVLDIYGWKCYYCHKDLDNPEKDHKLPITRGGRATIDNIVPTCHACNCRKNDRTIEEYREYLISIGETPLF
jgi:uncharacterized Zn finger protein (UPF0148 family)